MCGGVGSIIAKGGSNVNPCVKPKLKRPHLGCRVLFFSLFQWILPNYSMNSSGRCSNWFTTAGEN